MKHTSSTVRRLLRAGLLPALLLAVLPASARAASVTVDCDAVAPPPGVFTSINAALLTLDLVGPHTITVTGTCTENVNVSQFNRLTIEAPPGQTATVSPPAPGPNAFTIFSSHNIVLRRLVITGGGNGLVITRGSTVQLTAMRLTGNAAAGLIVTTGSVVNIGGPPPDQFTTVSGNGGQGVGTDAADLTFNGGLTVEENAGLAMSVIGGRVRVSGQPVENVFRNNGGGITLDGTVANFNGRNTIQNNNLAGVQVVSGRANFSGVVVPSTGETRSTTIEGHTLGINVVGAAAVGFFGPNRIRNNGGGNPDAEFRGGVRIGTSARVQINGPNEITNNTGYGVLLDFNGSLAIAGASVTNNTEGGVRVARSSVGSFDLGGTYSGNGGAQISCDDTSLIFGPGLAGLGNKAVACKNIEHAQGPPRPSVPKEQEE